MRNFDDDDGAFPSAGVTTLPIDTIFRLPSPLPDWPHGNGFSSGIIDLGGLKVRQIWSFDKVSEIHHGGPENLGASFFEPSHIPEGFSMLGSYAQSNNKPLFGWVLVGESDAGDESGEILKQPIDYNLVFRVAAKTKTTKEFVYLWLPIPPDGYEPLGYVVTTSPTKPHLDKIKCARSDFTDKLENDSWIWGEGNEERDEGLKVYASRPKNRGSQAEQLNVGTFIIVQSSCDQPLACLKNKHFNLSPTMPNLAQVNALFQEYSPYIYFHPDEMHLPSSVEWYFSNGALLYQKGNESNPVAIEPNGSNLPQDGSNDGSYWLDLPADTAAQEFVKSGELNTAEVYLHSKPMLGATFTDIQVWIFYPFNGPATAKLGKIEEIPLGKIGEHVGDWEHITLRISNFNGILQKVYFAQHNAGEWVESSSLEFHRANKFIGYSSRNGHASYPKEGSNLQGTAEIGLRNDTVKSEMALDTGSRFSILAADHLCPGEEVVASPWLNYLREWGPKRTYQLRKEIEILEKLIPKHLKSKLEKLIDLLPDEIFGEHGPTGPKMKDHWYGDERDDKQNQRSIQTGRVP